MRATSYFEVTALPNPNSASNFASTEPIAKLSIKDHDPHIQVSIRSVRMFGLTGLRLNRRLPLVNKLLNSGHKGGHSYPALDKAAPPARIGVSCQRAEPKLRCNRKL
jgi:hypothetical protein